MFTFCIVHRRVPVDPQDPKKGYVMQCSRNAGDVITDSRGRKYRVGKSGNLIREKEGQARP